MNDDFKTKCYLLRDCLEKRNSLLDDIKQQIIIEDLSKAFNRTINSGRMPIKGYDWIEEIFVDGEVFTLINKAQKKYSSYVIYTDKQFYCIGLGFKYKNEIVSPHIDFGIEDILKKYRTDDVKEISKLIDEALININEDIDYLKANNKHSMYSHYYGEYNKGFESINRYESIEDVINEFKM